MRREEVYQAIDTEREFVEEQKPKQSSHIVEEFPIPAGIAAMQYKLDLARASWYEGTAPHELVMHEIRKIASIAVLLGEQFGMPDRKKE